jgi:hypothetical protein
MQHHFTDACGVPDMKELPAAKAVAEHRVGRFRSAAHDLMTVLMSEVRWAK